MSNLRLSIREAQRNFFDRQKVINAVDAMTRKLLSRFGAFVRIRARSSLRKARQKTLSEMSPDEIVTYEIRKRYAKKHGLKNPKRPLASSKPGEPPRMISGLLKQYLYFVYEPETKSLVVGPVKLEGHSEAPHVLEWGGNVELKNHRTARIEPRPYMRPAFESELGGLMELWDGALNDL